jgi:tetratricopeptide (TPR) repeat protein/predicted Ser/Thr protein kinase
MSNDAALRAAGSGNGSATMTGQLGLYELRVGDVLANRFRIVSLLGIGGMGVVYRGHDQALDVDVAVKVLRPELARKPEAFERFRQELLLARQVSSPHVVRIHDIAEHDGRWFITMDFIDGDSLEKRLDGNQKLPTGKAIGFAHDLLDGLSAAHQRGVVHRDLKPANVLIDDEERAYITDFGVARSLGATGLTHSGVIIGTPEYLSPEQARGEVVDARSDLYAVGLILYEMLTGVLPFSTGTPAETVMQRIVRQPPSLSNARPDLPGWLQAFTDRLLKLNPAHRFQSARDALRALDTRKVPRAPLNRRLLAVAALAFAVIAGASAWLIKHPIKSAAVPVVTTPQWAIFPVSSADPTLADTARGFDEHLRTWLRDDASIAVIPRRRMEQAVARTVPDADASTRARLSASIANAANATQWLRGDLRNEGDELVLQIDRAGAGESASTAPLIVRGRDVASLFEAYVAALPGFANASGLHIGAAPRIDTSSIGDYGASLAALDQNHPDVAAKRLAPLAEQQPDSTLIVASDLRAQESANQDLPAQNLRDDIVKRFATKTDAASRELFANALAGSGQDEKADVALAQAAQAFPHDAALALAYADILRQRGDGEKAMSVLKNYVDVANDDARAWFMLGRTAIGQGHASDAVEDYLLHAQTLNVLAHDPSSEAETRNAAGIGYERLGQLDAAAEQYQRAIALREKLGDKTGLAKSLRNLAIVQAEQGKRDEAEKTLTRAAGLLESLGDRASMADLYNDRGVVAEEAGDFAEALKYYRQAYGLRQQLDNATAIAESLNNIGFASYRMGDFDNASVYWKQAMDQYKQLGDHNGILHIQQSIGLLDIARGQFAKARKDLIDSLDYAEGHQLPEESAVAQVSLTELNLLEGRYADAAASVEQAAKIFARRADERGNAEVALLKARIAIALGDRDGAKKLLDIIDANQLNAEQTAEFAIAQAQQFALADARKEQASKLDEAAKAAADAHSGTLSLRVNFERIHLALAEKDTKAAADAVARIREQALRLNDVPLRLVWLELQTALALQNRDNKQAAAHYREALPLLKNVETYARADLLHTMGELALADDQQQHAAARAAASAENARLLAAAPPPSRDTLKSELARRQREETGRADAI